NDLLHARRSPCPARNGRSHDYGNRPDPCPVSASYECQPIRSWADFLVLALCRRRLGCRFQRCLPAGALIPWIQTKLLTLRIARMASEVGNLSQPVSPAEPEFIETPRPTAAPIVLGLGLTLLATGVAVGTAFLVVGALVIVAGLSIWIFQLLPGQGHIHEFL